MMAFRGRAFQEARCNSLRGMIQSGITGLSGPDFDAPEEIAMGEEEDRKQGFKIEDKRRFDDRGNQRGASEPEARRETPAAAAPEGAPRQAAPDDINFASFVMSLATQALIQLGEMSPPEGFDIAPDRTAARQTIQILKVLEQKTKGNLDSEETHLLTEILHTLQMSFVRSK